MTAEEFIQLKESALRQFSMTACDGVCREGVALLTQIGMIFSGCANNEDSHGAVRNALDACETHKARAPGNTDKFNIVAIVLAVNNQNGVVAGGTMDDILYAENIRTDAAMVVISGDGKTQHPIDLATAMPSLTHK